MKNVEAFKVHAQPEIPGTAHGDELCYLFRYAEGFVMFLKHLLYAIIAHQLSFCM